MATTEFNIEPYIGALPVKFGMTMDEVADILGAPDKSSTGYRGDTVEWRGSVNFGFSKGDQKLFHVGFSPKSNVVFKGVKLMEQRDPLETLLKYDPKPLEILGALVFFDLGISATGFHDGQHSNRAIVAFEKGRWDKHRVDGLPWTADKAASKAKKTKKR